ncbi:4-alpha-glucanotransferase [Novosphingobium sp. 1949]|uniref:4-alpha-glucanotransferase n=1 Tax=Novosphingobium organovorum TaxID=2930092 RepID=A0ABT0BB64_9SPHN|nr:4-alpha-glucanotransferase [Novosphingobium organovorum]MCJ2182039.1 4-alpha-glucanotransferase [Novosphingobium organovorum]
MEALHELAQALGLSRQWRDVDGCDQIVSDRALQRIAAALGYPATTPDDIAASLAALRTLADEPPAMLVTEVGLAIPLPASLSHVQRLLPDGSVESLAVSDATLPAFDEPGYHDLVINGEPVTLAVAPRTCPGLAALLPENRHGERLWGPAVQVSALRGAVPRPYGTLAELSNAVRLFAARGADALAINPVHALFAGVGQGYSPYSPSSRQHLNTALAAPELLGLPALALPPTPDAALIDWEHALPQQQAALRTLFAELDEATRARFEAACKQDDSLRRHALFDALDAHFRGHGLAGWPNWPEEYHDPDGEAVARAAARNPEQVRFHMFTQWLTREGLAVVQAEARAAGMAIGLMGDLAVGVHTGGSDSWGLRGQMLEGLTIGAPPDPLGPLGQNWNLTAFSPEGLRRSGYAPWIAMLRSAFALTGALRIDHAFGMARLWVIPEGANSGEGAYLTYPFEDMLRLLVLEAHLSNTLLVAENLGTAPFGFLGALEQRRLLDMRVLWFERAGDDGFIGAADYPADSVAMTGTHDTATVAGWWTGRDLEWAQQLGRLPEGTTAQDAAAKRDWDRGLLWATLTHDAAPRPAPEDPAPVVAAALAHIGRTPAALAIAPLEDIVCEIEQPNLPGTIDEHPNWRRRMPAPLATMLDDPATQERIATLDKARKSGT